MYSGQLNRHSTNGHSAHHVKHYVESQHGFDWDDTEHPYFTITPQEDVYSFLMFLGPTEGIKSGGKNWLTIDVSMAYFLVLMTVVIQSVVLYAIWDRVVLNTIQWEMSIVNTNSLGNRLIMAIGEDADPLGGAPPPPECNSGRSLCRIEDGLYTCAPPSVQLTGRWAELDTNGDGVWTRKEAEAAQQELQCKYVVDPLLVFDVFANLVIAREKIIWVHPDVKKGKAIAKPYFTYAAGDIIMCMYRNDKMCANVLERGYFDAPLTHNTVPRVGNSIDSALEYCYQLLKPGGTCETVLPSTYSVWKVASDQECKKKTYSKFSYTNPNATMDESKSLLSVDYKARKQYEKVYTNLFITYKTIIIVIWVVAMVYELKDKIKSVTWLCRMPGEAECEQQGLPLAKVEDDDTWTINGITRSHRFVMSVITFIRILMLAVLSVAGTSLLLNSPEYMSLIFDAVALYFVIELANLIWFGLIREKIRTEISENINGTRVEMYGIPFCTHRPGVMDLSWLIFAVGIAMGLVYIFYRDSVGPLKDAIECTCVTSGDKCREAKQFDYDFWYDYWKVKTPQVFRDVEVLKKQEEEALFRVFTQMNTSLAAEAAPTADAAVATRAAAPLIAHHRA
jgi:hypothetical protein